MRSILVVLFLFTVWSPAKAHCEEAHPSLVVLAYGDSLTAGYGLKKGEGFTDQLESWLANNLVQPVKVINAGVSGDTSTGGVARLEWTTSGLPGGYADIVILELGANDLLRGIQPHITKNNIASMIEYFQKKNMKVLLAGMKSPASYGPDYQKDFDGLFTELSKKYETALYPFFLNGVAMEESLNQSDGIHPNKEGVSIIVNNIGPFILDLAKN